MVAQLSGESCCWAVVQNLRSTGVDDCRGSRSWGLHVTALVQLFKTVWANLRPYLELKIQSRSKSFDLIGRNLKI